MKIKLSKTQWEAVGFKAGWIKKAGGDQFVNDEYTKNVAKALVAMGDDIYDRSGNQIDVFHKILDKNHIALRLRIFEEEYGGYSAMAYLGKEDGKIIGMPSGETPEELIENLNVTLRMILDEISYQDFLKEI